MTNQGIQQIGYSTDSMPASSSSSSKTGFGEILGMAATSFGGPAMEYTYAKSDAGTQAITSAAVNGTIGSASLMVDSSKSLSPYSYGGISSSSLGTYSTGGLTSLTRDSSLTSSTSLSDAQNEIALAGQTSYEMIMMQSQMGSQSVITNALSNTINQRNTMELAVIRNMKTS